MSTPKKTDKLTKHSRRLSRGFSPHVIMPQLTKKKSQKDLKDMRVKSERDNKALGLKGQSLKQKVTKDFEVGCCPLFVLPPRTKRLLATNRK